MALHPGPLRDGDLELLDSAARLHGLPLPSDWLHDMSSFQLQCHWPDAHKYSNEDNGGDIRSIFLSLILLNMPNLQTLSLFDDFQLLHLHAGALPSLKTLLLSPNYVGNDSRGGDATMRPNNLALGISLEILCLAAPNLEHLYLDKCDCMEEELEPCLENLLTVTIQQSLLQAEDIACLLIHCNKLQGFIYDSTGYKPDRHPYNPEYMPVLDVTEEPQKLIGELLLFKTSLRHIELVMGHVKPNRLIRHLQDFEVCETLVLTENTIWQPNNVVSTKNGQGQVKDEVEQVEPDKKKKKKKKRAVEGDISGKYEISAPPQDLEKQVWDVQFPDETLLANVVPHYIRVLRLRIVKPEFIMRCVAPLARYVEYFPNLETIELHVASRDQIILVLQPRPCGQRVASESFTRELRKSSAVSRELEDYLIKEYAPLVEIFQTENIGLTFIYGGNRWNLGAIGKRDDLEEEECMPLQAGFAMQSITPKEQKR